MLTMLPVLIWRGIVYIGVGYDSNTHALLIKNVTAFQQNMRKKIGGKKLVGVAFIPLLMYIELFLLF